MHVHFVGRVLHVDGHDVFSGRREGGIEERRNGSFQVRRAGKLTVLGSVEGAFEIIDFGADVDARGESGIGVSGCSGGIF
jgi:hypothetical protein